MSGFAHPQGEHEGLANPRGLLRSEVPGRTDHIHAAPSADSYVIPADVVSGLGEGNTEAGAKTLDIAFHMPAHETEKYASGGAATTSRVPCLLAGGEYVVPPEVVKMFGNGDVKAGHKEFDKFVVEQRAKIIKTMKGLKGPVKSR